MTPIITLFGANERSHNVIYATYSQIGITIGFGLRPGTPPQTTRCDQITSVPRELTFITRYPFYRKYTHAYGIPIISSYYSDDAALKRACYNVKVLLADNPKIRYWMYKVRCHIIYYCLLLWQHLIKGPHNMGGGAGGFNPPH